MASIKPAREVVYAIGEVDISVTGQAKIPVRPHATDYHSQRSSTVASHYARFPSHGVRLEDCSSLVPRPGGEAAALSCA